MKVIVFGIGGYYREQKETLASFHDIEIVAFTDNNALLWNKEVDGIIVIPPDFIQTFEYDNILIMSLYVSQIYVQLLALGIEENRIIIWDRFCMESQQGKIKIYGAEKNKETAKQKVLLISQKLHYDGGTWAAVYAARALIKDGIYVRLAVPGGNEKLIHEVTEKGIGVAVCPTLPYIFDADKKWIQQFDVVIVNLFTMLESAYEIHKFCPILWWIHEAALIYEPFMMKYYPASEYVRKMSEMNIYAVSNIAKQNFNSKVNNLVKKTLAIGIPDESGFPEEKFKEDKKTVFAIIGTVHILKAQDIFVKAALKTGNLENAEFWIIGRMSNNQYCQRIQEMAAGVNSIRILGEMTREEINKAYSEIDVLVCASHEETLSITIIEAMMFTKACITTDRTGIAEYIKNGVNGFIIPDNDADALAEKMQWLMEDRNRIKELGEAARKTYEKYFTLDIFSRNLKKALCETQARWRNQ